MGLTRELTKLLAPLHRKLRLMATRGVVKLVDPGTLLQQLQIAAVGEELLDNIEHWEPYGFTSNPQAGAEALLLALGGDRDHAVAVNVADRRFRLKGLASGEVALATDEGDVIHFKRNNEILIDTLGTLVANAGISATITTPLVKVVASTKVIFDTPLVECTNDLHVGGNASIDGTATVAGAATFSSTVVAAGAMSSATSLADPTGTLAAVRVTFNSHNHNETGSVTNGPNQSM